MYHSQGSCRTGPLTTLTTDEGGSESSGTVKIPNHPPPTCVKLGSILATGQWTLSPYIQWVESSGHPHRIESIRDVLTRGPPDPSWVVRVERTNDHLARLLRRRSLSLPDGSCRTLNRNWEGP